MSKRYTRWAFVLWLPLLCFAAAWAQDSSPQQPEGSMPDSSPQQPAPAYGQDNPVPSIAENPPISGLDLPNLEPHAAPLSYLQAGAHFSESVSSNVLNALGGSDTSSITDGLGSLDLERLWSNYDLSLAYLGGVGYYNRSGIGFRQIEELGLNQKITWKRGEFGIRDAFSYQPEGYLRQLPMAQSRRPAVWAESGRIQWWDVTGSARSGSPHHEPRAGGRGRKSDAEVFADPHRGIWVRAFSRK
jgi:hypothetical protein